ncbi:MAG: hypothetical protein R2774_12800 [Saprospiraceae bacterium]
MRILFLSAILIFTLAQCKNESSHSTKETVSSDSTPIPTGPGKAIVQRDILSNEFKTIRGVMTLDFDTIIIKECNTNILYKVVDTLNRIEPTFKSIHSQYPSSRVYGEMEIVKSRDANSGNFYFVHKLITLNQLTEKSHCGPVSTNAIIGQGNEPGWRIEIVYSDNPVLPYNLVMDYGQSKMSGSIKKVSGNLHSLPLVFEAKDGDGKLLQVTIKKSSCTDDAGNQFNESISVTYLDKKFNGCAKLPLSTK